MKLLNAEQALSEAMIEDPTIRHFHERGWAPAERLFTPVEAQSYAQLGVSVQSSMTYPKEWMEGGLPDFEQRPWFKSLHAILPEFFDLGTHPAIISRVKQVLGENVILWGTALLEKPPGAIHRWHVDVEHTIWPGVSVFVGLSGVRPGLSGLKFIGGSHLLDQAPKRTLRDTNILAQAIEINPTCTLDYPSISDGECMLFGGSVWHGSANRAGETRHAVVLQYTSPQYKVAIPLTFVPPVLWSEYQPPCVLAAGRDEYGLNRLVSRPSASET